MYAIIDIETTGGRYNEEGITEIAIYCYNGEEITDQFISLINPERPIQPFVINLTGINNDMLRNAPKFYEIAKRIVEITQGCTLVAHNAIFDYRMLQIEFERLGYSFELPALCTVELTQKLIPGLESYSLGKLVKALGIPIANRHRASGDALATLRLFKLLLERDISKEIISSKIRTRPKLQIEKRLSLMLESLPTYTGIYYLHDKSGNILYIGKSKNIRKRLTQHFTNQNRKSKELQTLTDSVSFDRTGSELIALLKESAEIKTLKPPFNKTLRRNLFSHALYSDTDECGYIQFKIGKADPKKRAITTFTSLASARGFMQSMLDNYGLCRRLSGLETGETACFNYSIKKCEGACLGIEDTEDYNLRAQKIIDKYTFAEKDFLIIDRGREMNEQVAILIEDGLYRGFTYFDLNYQIHNPEVLRNLIQPCRTDRDLQHILHTYVRMGRQKKLVPLIRK